MAFQYPPKPWQDGEIVRQELPDGTVLVGQYNSSKNLWKFGRSTDDGTSGIITTADVYTLNERPDNPAFPFALTNDPADVQTQQEVNWWLYEHLGARAPIFSDTEPTSHPGYVAPDNELIQGDTWIDTSDSAQLLQFIWSGTEWLPISSTGRRPIFSDTEPTVHPDYEPGKNELKLDDHWYNITNPDIYYHFIWNGNEWISVDNYDRHPIVQRSAPTQHPKFPGEPLQEGDLWLDDSDSAKMALYAWDLPNATWVPIGDSGRPPIFSDTEPTEHPDFIAPNNQLEAGDIWYDTTDPDEIVQYIYDGTNWLKIGGDFVHRKGGDNMEGPLSINGGRNPNVDGIVSTIEVLNVDSGQDSALHLKQNGATKVYVGKDLLTTATDVKFNANNMKVKSNTDTDLFTMNSSGVFYEGAYSADKHIVTKEKLEEAIDDLKTAHEDYYNSLVFKEPDPAINTMPLLNVEQPHTWAGGGAVGQLWFDIANDGNPFHIGFKAPVDLNPYDEGLAIKFTHDSGVMYARIAARWHSGQVHLNLKDVVGDILVDGEQTTKIEVQDSIFVERAGDSMYGDLVMDDAKIEFPNIAPDATAIKMKRTAGEDATLIRLENSSASPNSANFYNIELGGNSFYNGMQIKGGSGADEIVWRVRSGSGGEMSFFKEVSFEGNAITKVGDGVNDTDAATVGQVKAAFDKIVDTASGAQYQLIDSPGVTNGQMFAYGTNGAFQPDPALVDNLLFRDYDQNGIQFDFSTLDGGERVTLVNVDTGLLTRFTVQSVTDNTDRWTVDVAAGEGDTLVDNAIYNVVFQSFSTDVDLADYLKLDASNGPVTGNLAIDVSGAGTGNEAQLTLKGNRTGATNAAATLIFDNESQASATAGYLTYRSSNNSSDGEWFKFNKDVDFSGKGLHSVSHISPSNEANKKITLRNPASNSSDAAVEIARVADTRHSFAIRGKDKNGVEHNMLDTYMNAGGPDAVNYTGKMDGNTNLVNLAKVKELISGGGFGETFITHGAWRYAGAGATVSQGQWTSDVLAPKQIRQLTFHNKNQEGEDIEWSDLVVGEIITIVQYGNFGGQADDDWLIINYEVTDISTFSAATVIDVSAHWSVVVFSNGYAQYNPSDTFGFLENTDTYALESQPATLNNIVQLAKKTSAAPAFNVYDLQSGTSEPLVGIASGVMICSGNQQTPTKFIFGAQDKYGNGHKWGNNPINCPGSIIELYRKNADGTLILCKVYSFTDIVPYATNKKYEIRGLVQKFSATNGNGYISSPGTFTAGAQYLIRWKFSFGTTTASLPYEIDAEGDTHWGDHRLEDVGVPVAATDAATKGYVDSLFNFENYQELS